MRRFSLSPELREHWLLGASGFIILAFNGVMTLVSLPPSWGAIWNIVTHFVEAFGVALLIAFVLAIRIDARLKHALVADAGKAALGSVVPETLRPDVRGLDERHVMCNEHVSRIRI